MKHNLIYDKPQAAYKIPNPNFPQQLCVFLSQSKHQKQQQYSDINQYMVQQFIHLFEICNINRFIDYTDEFINQIRNVILRLQLVQKRSSQYLDQKDEFMYLIVEGKVQKVKRQKPILNKRVSKLNMTGFNLQSNSIISLFNPRSSHQTLHNIQLKEFQKSVIMDRHSRMSIMSGNLWNEMTLSPKKKNKVQDKNHRGFSSFCNDQKVSELSVNRAQIHKFQQKIKQQKGAFYDKNTILLSQQSNNYGTQLLQPLEEQVYQCLTSVKYIKILKWSYDQLIQYVFKYQNDKLIQFLSKNLLISEHDIKFHQIYNKTAFHFYPKKESQHSNMFIGLEKGSLFILRKGSVEMKYQSKSPFVKNQNNSNITSSTKNNPNLAEYVNKQESFYKKVVLNQGAIICPELQTNKFFIQSLQDVVLIQINHCLFQILKSQLKDNWWNKKFKLSYQKIKADRSLYMKDQQIHQKLEIKELKMKNVSIQSKSGKFGSKNKQKSRFRAEAKMLNDKQNIIKENSMQDSQDKQNNQEDFNSQQYKQFISFLPYEIMIKSKEKISMKLNQKSKNRHISNKVFNYLKKNQKGNSSSKYKNKVFQLKMKNIASKQINPKDLENLYNQINNDGTKKQFHKSLKGNWFKEETQISSDPTFDDNAVQRTSILSPFLNKNLLMDKKGLESYKSSTFIGELDKNNNGFKKNSPFDNIQSTRNVDKKVTFINDQKQNSSQQEYLCSDDTGLISKFVQNSHNYQKELIFLLNSSQREEKSQMKNKKKLKTCKTEGSNVIFSHNLINDIMKRVNNTKKKSTIMSNKNSQKASKTQSACDKAQSQNFQQAENKFDNKIIRLSEDNNSNTFSAILSGMVDKKVQIHDGHVLQNKKEQILKDKKTSSFTNQSSLRSSSCQALNYNKIQSLDRRRTSIDRKYTYVQSAFFKENIARPYTAEVQTRQQCRSLFFNQWIETQSGIAEQNNHRNSDLGVGNYNFCGTNISSGDKKIWKRLKSGKIVKKSVKFYNKKNTTINIQSTAINQRTVLN